MKRRARARGAAMVEAIVVMCTMLVFFGMNIWAFQTYGGKIDQMSSTRRDALYFASHSCEKRLEMDPDDYTVPQLRGNNSTGGSSMTLMGIVKALLGKEEFDYFGTARSTKGPTAVLGTALTKVGANGAVKSPLRAELKTASAVSCNEKRMGDGIGALIGMGWDFVKGLFD